MRKTRIVICDQNPNAVQFYEMLCRKICQSQRIPAEIKIFQDARSLIFELGDSTFCKELDIVFYSINDANDMDAIDAMRKSGYAGLIVLLSETIENISIERIFDSKVFNFVRKTNEQENIARFTKVLRLAADIAAKAYSEKISFTYGGEMCVVNVVDIIYIERQGRGVEVCYGEGEKFYFLSSITKMEEQLKGKDIVKSSGSFLVNLSAIIKLSRMDALMRDGTKIPVSRSCYREIRDELEIRGVELN